ncbi:MAG: metallophosphoesterase [Actinomycetota bacterium]
MRLGRLGRVDEVQVSIGVPPVDISGTFRPSRAEQEAAWELLVELASRIATAPLKPEDGSIREALTSLYNIFNTTREILREHGPEVGYGHGNGNLSLGLISMRVLNEILRPKLARWHPRLKKYEEHKPEPVGTFDWEERWPDADECRADLTEVRTEIRAYIDTLAQITGTPELTDAVLPHPPQRALTTERPAKKKLPFSPRKPMVRWFDVGVLAMTAGVLARDRLGGRGRLPEVRPSTGTVLGDDDEEFWFDYVADLGDGLDPTLAVAWQLSAEQLDLPADDTGELPPIPEKGAKRGSLLVFGGDEVYPYASQRRYEQQLIGPYAVAAVHHGLGNEQRDVLAIPGNHDWMGGISHFERVFTVQPGGSPDQPGPWTVHQTNRFFAAELPHRWWIWGMDTGLHGTVDEPQLEWFAEVAKQLQDGDRIILCSPVPMWQLRQKRPEQYHELRQRLDELLSERRASVDLYLSGDSHYFAHYEEQAERGPISHITAGGGGAFLHPTHALSERLPNESGPAEFRLTSRWPSPSQSRALIPNGGLIRNRQFLGFGVIVAALAWVFAWLVRDRGVELPNEVNDVGGWPLRSVGWVLSAPLGWIVLAVLIAGATLAVLPNSREPALTKGARVRGFGIGLALAAVIVLASATTYWLLDIQFDVRGGARDWWFLGSAIVTAGITLWLFVDLSARACRQLKVNDNLAFSAARLTRYKHFLRCRIDTDGALTVYALGIDPVGEGWASAFEQGSPVPPLDRDGVPHLHYVWGKRYEGRVGS